MLYTNRDISRLPNILQLREILKEYQEHFPTLHRKPYEMLIPDSNKFVLTPLGGRKYAFKPNITGQGVLFHGVNNVITPYYSDFYLQDNKTRLCEYLKIHAFLFTAKSHPLFSLLKDGIDLGAGKVFVVYNPLGLAACYGYSTPFVQLTSSLDTAIMYATTKIIQNDGLRYLDQERDPKVGTIYVFDIFTTFSKIKGLSSVGLQAFERPGRMQEFVYRLNVEDDFNKLRYVKGFTFRHDIDVEKRLLNNIHRPKRADALSVKNKQVYSPNGNGVVELPINVLKIIESTEHNKIIDVLKERIHFVEDNLERFQFSFEDLADVNLVQRWNNMIDQVVPSMPSDQIIIDRLRNVPYEHQYSRYFDINEWFEHLNRQINE